MGNWIIDKVHSTIGFEVTHMMISRVRGEFDSFHAKIEVDDLVDLTNAAVAFTIDANSITTRFEERDKHLKSADFFSVDHYPFIDFKSTEINKSNRNDNYKVQGDLTIKGITKQVIFDVALIGKATDPLEGEEVYGFEAEAHLNREDFGLLWNTALETGGVLVGKEVKINVNLELKRENSLNGQSINVIKQSPDHHELNKKDLSRTNFHQLITENITDLVILMDQNGAIKYVTPSLNQVLGYEDASSFQRRNFFHIIHPDDKMFIKEQVISYAKRTMKNTFNSEFRLCHHDGHYVDIEADIIFTNEYGLIQVVTRDISEQKEAKKEIYKLAFNDSLTKLPNRSSFLYQLRNEVVGGKYPQSKHSVLFIDLDDFKLINDKWGHDAGDIALQETAKRIRSVIRPTDVAARYGGDEFIILLKDVPDEQQAIIIAERLLDQFNEPINEVGGGHFLTPSIGVAHYPNHGETPEELIKNADTALYNVKEQGKTDFNIFNGMMEHQSLERSILENALRQGLEEQQFYLVYQPKVNITTNEIIGMEALVRWNHPELGVIPPLKFIPLAEETGLIVPLGEWILRKGCRQAVEWKKLGYSTLNLSINISVRELEDIHFVDKLKTILNETGLNPKRLELEITESVLANLESTVAILQEIRKLGVLISVDDFGTGYSSLSYIKELPIDTIKIDQLFVKDIHTNKESKEIVKALINLANSIGLNAIAEGIEQKEHVDELKEDGYILGQGYYYSKPLDVNAFEDFMQQYYGVS